MMEGQSGSEEESKKTRTKMIAVVAEIAIRAEKISQSHQSCKSREIPCFRDAGFGTLLFNNGV
jgi:hypothetical protein